MGHGTWDNGGGSHCEPAEGLHGTWDMGHGTWDMGHGKWSWDMGHGMWNLGLGAREMRHRIMVVVAAVSLLGGITWNMGHGTWDKGHGTWDL